MDATRIIAVRHGETAWNVDGRIQGQRDIALDEKGLWQAQRVARGLAAGGESITALYSSDLLRAWNTAEPIGDALALVPIADQGLRERCFGAFEGSTFVELEAAWPQQTARWRTRDSAWAPPGGETLAQLRQRALHTACKLAARHAGGQIVLVTHGGVLDALYRAAAGLGMNAPRTWTLANASINRLLWTPQGLTLVGWADIAHLDGEWQDETVP